MNKKGRFGTPTGVSPHPKKEPFGPIPYEFCFDFSQDPNSERTNYLDNIHDTTFSTSTISGNNLTAEYNQTVAGRDKCAKYTVDANFADGPNYIQWGAIFDPEYFEGQNEFGRVSSPLPYLPITQYKSFFITFEYYVSGINTNKDYFIGHRALYSPTNIYNIGAFEDPILEDEWVSASVGTDKIVQPSRSFTLQFKSSYGSEPDPFFNEQGGFVAIRNFCIKFTP